MGKKRNSQDVAAAKNNIDFKVVLMKSFFTYFFLLYLKPILHNSWVSEGTLLEGWQLRLINHSFTPQMFVDGAY